MNKCSTCGTELIEGSTASKLLMCIPCREKRSLFNDPEKNIRHFQKRLDHQLIDIERVSDKKDYAEYSISTAISDIDPRFRSRNIRVGIATGYLRIYKETGQIEVIYPIPGDDKESILRRAESVLLKAYANNEFPVKTCFASG